MHSEPFLTLTLTIMFLTFAGSRVPLQWSRYRECMTTTFLLKFRIAKAAVPAERRCPKFIRLMSLITACIFIRSCNCIWFCTLLAEPSCYQWRVHVLSKPVMTTLRTRYNDTIDISGRLLTPSCNNQRNTRRMSKQDASLPTDQPGVSA